MPSNCRERSAFLETFLANKKLRHRHVTSGEKIVTDKGKTIADADSEPVAEEIAERLNEDAARKEEDRWA